MRYGELVAGIIPISIATPFASDRIFEKWFSFPNIFLLAPIPLMTGILVMALEITCVICRNLMTAGAGSFVITITMFILCFHGLAYSFLSVHRSRSTDDCRGSKLS